MHEASTDLVEEVTVQLAGLEITLTARRLPGARATISARASRVFESEASNFILGYDPVSQDLIRRSLAASGPTALANLPLRFLDHFRTKLRGADSTWTPAARIGRAFAAGVAARLRLEGELLHHSTESTPFRVSCYICLRAPGFPDGFWTLDYNIYAQHVLDSRGEFHRTSISHGFATQVEAEVYCVGAGRSWPQRLQ